MIDFNGIPLNLPEWVKRFRPHQEDAIYEIMRHFESRRVVMLDAPTGAGKTLIGEVVRQLAIYQRQWTRRGVYLCTTKTLQAQMLHDFPYAKVIKGRSNYPTLDNPDAFKKFGERHLNAGHCTKFLMGPDAFPVCSRCEDYAPDLRFDDEDPDTFMHCFHCHPWQNCPYEIAKGSALGAELAVANTSYFLTEANYVGRFGQRIDKAGNIDYHSRLVIIDEADTLEQIVMNHVELTISKRALAEVDLGIPTKVTVPSSWLEWCDMALLKTGAHVDNLAAQIARYKTDPPPSKLQDESDRWGRYHQQIGIVKGHIQRDPEGWVLDGYKEGSLSLRPIQISDFAPGLLWRHSERFLLMSATLISPYQMAADLGLQDHEWEAVEVRSSFPKERRPVYVRGTAKMSYTSKDTEYPKLAAGLAKVLDENPQDRILVHTVSYELTGYLMDMLAPRFQHRLLSYSTAREREAVLETFRRTHAAVLMAPSLDRGVDLKDDDCRVVVITKVPFPSTGDKRISKRLHGTATGESWYAMQTVRSLVQMTGRGMRHEDDYAASYILDSQFNHIIWRNPRSRNMVPSWWAESLVWDAPTSTR